MPEFAIFTGKPKDDSLDENIHQWAKMHWKYLLRKQVIKRACTQIGGCTKWPPEATDLNTERTPRLKGLERNFSLEDSVRT